jgi:hypothetical protein
MKMRITILLTRGPVPGSNAVPDPTGEGSPPLVLMKS